MKYLLSVIAVLTLALASCGMVPASGQEATAIGSEQSTQENASPETSPENSIEIVGGDEDSLREFIRQWMVPAAGPSQEVTVYIGSLPNDIPYDLPTPKDTRVIGSITGNWIDYMLIFETNLTSESVQEFYAQSLVDNGWQEAPGGQGGGFTSDTSSYRGYCYGENEAFLSVETPSISTEGTSIRLSLDVGPDHSVCNADPNVGMVNVNLIPELKAPKGVTVQGGGAGTSDRDANVTANLKGNLTAAEIADFYNEQLSAAGWEMQNESQGEGAAWSQWTFQDDRGTDWSGALMVVELSAESNALFALVTIEKNN